MVPNKDKIVVSLVSDSDDDIQVLVLRTANPLGSQRVPPAAAVSQSASNDSDDDIQIVVPRTAGPSETERVQSAVSRPESNDSDDDIQILVPSKPAPSKSQLNRSHTQPFAHASDSASTTPNSDAHRPRLKPAHELDFASTSPGRGPSQSKRLRVASPSPTHSFDANLHFGVSGSSRANRTSDEERAEQRWIREIMTISAEYSKAEEEDKNGQRQGRVRPWSDNGPVEMELEDQVDLDRPLAERLGIEYTELKALSQDVMDGEVVKSEAVETDWVIVKRRICAIEEQIYYKHVTKHPRIVRAAPNVLIATDENGSGGKKKREVDTSRCGQYILRDSGKRSLTDSFPSNVARAACGNDGPKANSRSLSVLCPASWMASCSQLWNWLRTRRA